MKRSTFVLVLISLCACVGCSSLKKRTTILPQNEWMQARLDGQEVYVKPLVKVGF